MPRSLTLVLFLTACGASETAPVDPRPTEPAPASSAAADDPTPTAAPTGPETCEGLVGMCGGWEGCVHVRPDATEPGRFVGVGDDAGGFFVVDQTCWEGTCNDMCWPDGSCRHGVRAALPIAGCSGAFAPEPARYHCMLTDGHCVRAGEVLRAVEVTVHAPAGCELLVDGAPSTLERTVAGDVALFRGTVDEGERRFACSGAPGERTMAARFGVALRVVLDP